jgi:hypothetical protein
MKPNRTAAARGCEIRYKKYSQVLLKIRELTRTNKTRAGSDGN